MNLFVTDYDPVVCAHHHCDVHLRKMIVETAQMLSTAHVLLDKKQVAYKKTHANHPSNVWIRKEKSNYMWAWELLKALSDEYTYRTGKVHKTTELYLDILKTPPAKITDWYGKRTFVPKCMPDEYKQICVPSSYKDYLNAKFAEWSTRDKIIRAQWTKRDVPDWVNTDYMQNYPENMLDAA